MNKNKLQQELLKKIKPGIKASDLKKQREKNTKTTEDEGYISDTQSNKSLKNLHNKNSLNKSEKEKNSLLKKDKKTKPLTPEQLLKKEIQSLQAQVKFESQKAQNYLEQITKLTAENDSKDLEIKELKKTKPTKTQQELEKALQEANQKIRNQEKTIQDLDYLLKSGN